MKKFLKDTSGATQIEYAFICVLVILAAMGAFLALGASSTKMINNVDSKVSPALKKGS